MTLEKPRATAGSLRWAIVPKDKLTQIPEEPVVNQTAAAQTAAEQAVVKQKPKPPAVRRPPVTEKTVTAKPAEKPAPTKTSASEPAAEQLLVLPPDAGEIRVVNNLVTREAVELLADGNDEELSRLLKMDYRALEDYLLHTQLKAEKEANPEHYIGEILLPEGIDSDRRNHPDRSKRFKRSRRAVDHIPFSLNRLSVSNLKKNFGRKHVVRGVGFYIRGGDVAGLLGPNGAGKTTIFYMIVGFLHPTEGSVHLNEYDITTGAMYKRARLGIAYLPQEASIFRKLSVEQNIASVLETRFDLSKTEKKHRLEELINDFSIDRIRKQPGYTLSGGERRRTEIARALAIEPKFLLLDEPFAGIDPIAVFDIKAIIRKLAARGIGILITDHNVRDTLDITNDAFIIADGTIIARGTKEMILNNSMVREIYLGNDFEM